MKYISESNLRPHVIVALPDDLLVNPAIVQLLAIICFCIQFGTKYLSRRTMADFAAAVWRDFDGVVLNADGSPYVLDEIDDVLGGDEDGDFPWLRCFFKYALEPAPENPQAKTIDRLRLIHLTILAAQPRGWRNLIVPKKNK